MHYLLDTHIFLWFLQSDERLEKKHHKIIIDENNTIFLSIASLWEIVLKYNAGKFILPDEPENFLLNFLYQYNFQILELKSEHLFYLSKLPAHHKDPFDRIIISQGIIEKMKVLSSDSIFKKYLK
jgi:PIN domain nuclease of toxin-antitoxin system